MLRTISPIYNNSSIMYSHNSNESLSDLFTRLSGRIGNHGDDYDIGEINVHNIKKTIRILIILLFTVTTVYITSNLHIIPKLYSQGFLITVSKYPVFSIVSILINTIVTAIYSYRTCLKSLKNITNKIKDKKTTEISHIWKSAPEICNKSLENIFLDIQNNFKDTDILDKNAYNISDIPNLDEKIEAEIGIKISELNSSRFKLIKLFGKKYKEFNLIKDKLLSVNKIKCTIKKWEENTKQLLDTFSDKDGIQTSIDEYLEKKMKELNYTKLREEFNKIYYELQTIVKFMNFEPNPNYFQKCNICLVNLKDSFLKECGHTACYNCLQKTKKDSNFLCPICRLESNKICKIYL